MSITATRRSLRSSRWSTRKEAPPPTSMTLLAPSATARPTVVGRPPDRAHTSRTGWARAWRRCAASARGCPSAPAYGDRAISHPGPASERLPESTGTRWAKPRLRCPHDRTARGRPPARRTLGLRRRHAHGQWRGPRSQGDPHARRGDRHRAGGRLGRDVPGAGSACLGRHPVRRTRSRPSRASPSSPARRTTASSAPASSCSCCCCRSSSS